MKQFWKRAAVAIVSLALLAGMPPAAGAASDEVEAALASMTLREKVGQLFAVRPEALDFEQRSGGMKLTCSMREHLRSYPVGGIVLFATNISSQSQMTALIRDFQRSAGNFWSRWMKRAARWHVWQTALPSTCRNSRVLPPSAPPAIPSRPGPWDAPSAAT